MEKSIFASTLFVIFCVLQFQTILSAEVVYNNTQENDYGTSTSEVGDTVTLGGSKRFITKLSVGIYATASDVGTTDNFYLAFYLPNAPGETPGSVIWQSTTLNYEITAEENQLVTFDVPHVRVPDTFIWSVKHSGGPWFSFAYTPSIGSTPTFYWSNLSKQEYYGNSILAKIEASDRPDAKLLATKRIASTGGQNNEDRNTIRFNLYPSSLNSFFGVTFAGITEWEVGTFPSQPASYFPEFCDILTNGQNDSIDYRVEGAGTSGDEDAFFAKSYGVSEGYPDLYGCEITDIGLKIDNIDIDHDTPDYTYYTYDVTWEIWGVEKSPDINKDGNVNALDFALLATAWGTQPGDIGWNPVCDFALPSDNIIDIDELIEFCSNWLNEETEEIIVFKEDFETGGFTENPWEFLFMTWWVTDNESSEGSYSVESPPIPDGWTSTMRVTVDTPDGIISFDRKVSTELNYDFLKFYIDTDLKGSWSGELDWSKVSYPVTAGIHTFKWVYEKDDSLSAGSDRAWVDQIEIKK